MKISRRSKKTSVLVSIAKLGIFYETQKFSVRFLLLIHSIFSHITPLQTKWASPFKDTHRYTKNKRLFNLIITLKLLLEIL